MVSNGTNWRLRRLCFTLAVVLPVIRVAFQPGPLCIVLIGSVRRIGLKLGLLPLPLPGSLTIWRGAEGLVWDVRVGDERFSAVCAVSGLHRISPYKNRMESDAIRLCCGA